MPNGAQNNMKSFVWEVTFLWSFFFRASLGEFGQKSFAAQKICLLLYSHVLRNHRLKVFWYCCRDF